MTVADDGWAEQARAYLDERRGRQGREASLQDKREYMAWYRLSLLTDDELLARIETARTKLSTLENEATRRRFNSA